MRWKRLIIIWNLLIFMLGGFSSVAIAETTQEELELYAQSAVLMDADSGRVLFGKEAETIRPMASTTKIMTCILALESGKIDDLVEVSEYAQSQPKVHLGVRIGEKYRLNDLLYSLMLESHNDSAVVIAEAVGGSVEEFAMLMNEKAKEIGCMDTHFVTPNGLDAEDAGGVHATTAKDLALIMKYCIYDSPEKEAFLSITQTKNYSFSDASGSRSFSCNNHNAFLSMMEGALSGKTGFTGDAGYCYVGALENDGRTFIVALLACGWPNNKSYKWSDTRKLMTYGMEHYRYQTIQTRLEQSNITVNNGIPRDGSLSGITEVPLAMKEEDWKILLGDTEQLDVKKELKQELSAPALKGQVVGSITYQLNGEEVKKYEITTAQSIGERTFLWCFYEIAVRMLK